jgi:hypothetical protein
MTHSRFQIILRIASNFVSTPDPSRRISLFLTFKTFFCLHLHSCSPFGNRSRLVALLNAFDTNHFEGDCRAQPQDIPNLDVLNSPNETYPCFVSIKNAPPRTTERTTGSPSLGVYWRRLAVSVVRRRTLNCPAHMPIQPLSIISLQHLLRCLPDRVARIHC